MCGEHAPRVCGARGGAAPGVGGGNKAAPAEHQPRGQCLQEDGRLALRTERVDGRVKMRKQRPDCSRTRPAPAGSSARNLRRMPLAAASSRAAENWGSNFDIFFF